MFNSLLQRFMTREEQENTIIRATVELLDDESTGDPSIRAIAERAGVSLGLVNYYFTSRDKLIRIAVRHHIQENVIRAYHPAVADGVVRGVADLATVIRGPLEYLYAHPKLARISILNDFISPDDGDNSALTYRGLSGSLSGLLGRELSSRDRMAVWTVVGSIHEAFLRHAVLEEVGGIDLSDEQGRAEYSLFLAELLIPPAI